jgi:lipopolysaccharide export system protein LptA
MRGNHNSSVQIGNQNATAIKGDNDRVQVEGEGNNVSINGKNNRAELKGKHQNLSVYGDGYHILENNGKLKAFNKDGTPAHMVSIAGQNGQMSYVVGNPPAQN